MCLAIYKPARAVIPEYHLENGYDGNPCGCGFCWPEGNKVKVVKGLLKFADFLKQYKAVEATGVPMLIHFRMATHGGRNEFNCHPFSMVDGKFALIHNGVIPITTCQDPETKLEMSDTNTFATLVVEPMLRSGIHPKKPAFRFLVEQTVGSYNKICVMGADGNVMIYNESQGDYEDAVDKDGKKIEVGGKQIKVWYSNSGYKYGRRRNNVNRWDSGDYEGYSDNTEGEVVEGPPNVVTGFSPVTDTKFNADGSKSAKDSAEAIADAIKKRNTVPIRLPSSKPAKNKTEEADETNENDEIEKGPIFKPAVELEITHLMQNMNMTRQQAVRSLQLEIADAITVID